MSLERARERFVAHMKYENLLRIRRVGRRDANCPSNCEFWVYVYIANVYVCVCASVLSVCVFCMCVFAFLLGSFFMQPQKLIGLWIVICDRDKRRGR